MYVPKNVYVIKPAKYALPLFMDLEHYEIFCYAYGMFKINEIERDLWIELVSYDERFIGIWYKTAYKRDADYIRCLRYLLLEAYETEFVFPTEEPILKLKRSINVKIDEDDKE